MKTVSQDEISLKAVVEILWQQRWMIFGVTAGLTILAGVAAWMQPTKYQAVIVISAVSKKAGSGAGGLSSLASQFGGLASLAGLSIGGDSDKSESLAVLQSAALTERYIEDNNLLPILFEKDWDPVGKKWTTREPDKIPTLWKANELFKEKIRVLTEDKKTGLSTLSITWTDPQVAAKWANDLVRLANDYLRNKAIQESERHIAYLSDQLAKTDLLQVRSAISAVLESEIKSIMLAKGTDEYALKVIDPAIAPERKFSPKLVEWVAGGWVSGLFLSIFIVYLRRDWYAGEVP